MSYRKPLPKIEPLNQPFWEHARRGMLAVQVCSSCQDIHFPPSPVCPHCLSSEQSWRIASGRGTLMSWADFHRAYWDGFKEELPYRVCLVRLEEGPLLVSNLLPSDREPRLDAPVEVVFESATEEIVIPKFKLA
jgi:uncharacterized OB-fold protein